MDQNHYRAIPYRDGGRTLAGMDCWGLYRYMLEREHSITGLPSLGGVMPRDISSVGQGYRELRDTFLPADNPQPGDAVCVFNADGDFEHVGGLFMGDRGLTVLHTTAKHGTETMPLKDFQTRYRTTQIRRYCESHSAA